MADTRRSTESKSKSSIRSLSAPAFQVRNNRTCFLRKIFAVNNDDLAYLARPPMGETNQTVAGQNKSAAKMSQKQVNLWFKERKYLMDKLDKAEDDVYQRLLSIQRTKMMIEKAREASPDRSSVALYARRTSRATNYRGDDEEARKTVTIEMVDEEQKENTENINPEGGETTETQENGSKNPESPEKPEGAKEANSSRNEGVKLKLDAVKEVLSPREIKAQETARLTDRPNTQANMSSRAPEIPVQTERAKTELGLIDEQTAPPVTPKVSDHETKPKSKQQLRVAEPSKLAPKKSTQEPKSNARRIEEKILNEPFTYWTQDGKGNLVPSDVPYKRREFPLPEERDDEGRKRDFLETEKRSKREYMKRFSHLCDDLQKLEEWNPLDEIRAMAELRKKAEKDEADAEERWKKLGMLRHWVRAFGMREERELQGLDPNSEEALQKCKYLRRKEKTNDSMDSKKRTPRKKDKRTKSKDPALDKFALMRNSLNMNDKDLIPQRKVQTEQERSKSKKP